MKNYLEVTLLPSGEIPLYFIWEKLYQQLHLALVESQNADKKVEIGVSFPEYQCGNNKHHLGSKLRVFATSAEALEKLNLSKWLSRLTDYIHITSIRDVPDKIESYAYFKRLQLKSNNARLARRKAKREGISEEQALAYFEGRKEQYSQAPFIRIKSLSSSRQYRLIIVRENAETNQTAKGYSSYGLSSESFVPIF